VVLLLAILAILSNQGSLMGIERFAKRHLKTLNELLGTHIDSPPSDSTFRLELAHLDVEGFEDLLQQVDAQHGGHRIGRSASFRSISAGQCTKASISERNYSRLVRFLAVVIS
jgi:hypothetical protein